MPPDPVRIPADVMRRITDVHQERNIYVHPNPLARDIFWQRLEVLIGLIRAHARPTARVLDFGGGSGAFLKALTAYFAHVDLVDLEPADAIAIRDHLGLANVTIHPADIRTFAPSTPYDVIIAADVLEHFQDLSVPLSFVQQYLAVGGLLCVSLPSENALYRLGRVVTRKTKPLDHYHSAAQVLTDLRSQGFTTVAHRWAPRYGLPLPLFDIAILRRAGS